MARTPWYNNLLRHYARALPIYNYRNENVNLAPLPLTFFRISIIRIQKCFMGCLTIQNLWYVMPHIKRNTSICYVWEKSMQLIAWGDQMGCAWQADPKCGIFGPVQARHGPLYFVPGPAWPKHRAVLGPRSQPSGRHEHDPIIFRKIK
jgi:hypothetical protein